jgi:hypothetical protein
MSLLRGLADIGVHTAKKKPFYSAVDETLANLKRNKGTGAEFLTEVMKTKGVKPAEVADRKLEQAFKAKGKMTKQEAQQVLADNPPPQVSERHLTEISDTERDDLLRDKIETSGYDSWDEVPSRVIRKWNEEIDEDLEKYSEYKTAGGQNYREMLLKLPKLDTSKGDNNYWSTHFLQDPNVLAHMRVQDRLIPQPPQKGFYVVNKTSGRQSQMFDTPEELQAYVETLPENIRNNVTMTQGERKTPPKKILHVEEIQSDWHQTGRKKGYKPDDYVEQSNALERAFNDLVVKRAELKDEAERIGYRGEGHSALVDEANSITPQLMQLQEKRDELQNIINYGVPDAPFKKNWHELAMKRLLNYAAENGYDSIAISPGAEQFRRYGSERIDWKKSDDGWTVGAKEQYGGDYGGQNIEEIARERGVLLENQGDPVKSKEDLHRIISVVMRRDNSKEQINKLTDRVWDRMQTEAEGTSLPRKEGMEGFYDKMLTDYLNSYGKDYGARVEMGSIPVSTRDPKSTSWGGGMPGDHPFITVQDLNEPFDGMVELMRRNADTGEETLVGRMTRPESERLMAEELQKLDTYNQIKLHNFPITPEMRESIKQKGLPLYQQVGIPTAGAGAASQMLEPQEEPQYGTGGAIAKMALKAAPEPRSPAIMRSSALTNVKSAIRQDKGQYGARRLDRAADEIPNLEKMFKQDALIEAFTGDNAKALMTMNPADFEKYAVQLKSRNKRPTNPSLEDRIRSGEIDKHDLPTDEYIKFLRTLPYGFDDVPFLQIDKQEYGLPLVPSISGHEGRHRSRALAESGENKSLVRLFPNPELREPLPRRSQEEYIEALKKELEMTGKIVTPEDYGSDKRPPIILPDIYAKGGAVKPQVKKSGSGTVKMTNNRDAMFMELSNKKLKRK